MNNQGNTFMDFYAGAGGFSAGFLMSGWKGLAAFEYEKNAAWTYWRNLCLGGWTKLMVDPSDEEKIDFIKKNYDQYNFPTIPEIELPDDNWINQKGISPMLSLWTTDIRKIKPEDVKKELQMENHNLGAIIGGPPCQGFSYANADRDMADERNELVFYLMDFIDFFQPKVFLIENVPGLLTLGKRKGEKEGPFPKWITKRAEDSGYNITYDIHNTKNFGIPQSRRRVIFYGTRKDLGLDPVLNIPITHDHNYFKELDKGQFSLFDDKKEPYMDVFEAIGDLTVPLSSSMDKDAIKYPEGSRERFSHEWTDQYLDENGYWHMKDRFTGKEFLVKNQEWTSEQKEHYKKCSNCGKINLKIRQQCHNCKTKF